MKRIKNGFTRYINALPKPKNNFVEEVSERAYYAATLHLLTELATILENRTHQEAEKDLVNFIENAIIEIDSYTLKISKFKKRH